MKCHALYYDDVLLMDRLSLRMAQSIYIVYDGMHYRLRALSTVYCKLSKEPLTRSSAVWRLNRHAFFALLDANQALVFRLFPEGALTEAPLTKEDSELCFGGELTSNNTTLFKRLNQENYNELIHKLSTAIFNKQPIEHLLQQQIDVNETCSNGATFVCIAAQEGYSEAIKILYDNGADLNQADNNGVNPLYIAAEQGHAEAITILLDKGADVNQANNNSVTPLGIAAYQGHIEVIKRLLDKGADVNQANNDSVTPLGVAAYQGHTEVIKILLDKGADVNQADNNGVTPLGIAAFKGYTEVIKHLLEKGAYINQANNDVTPLWMAFQNNHFEVVMMLVLTPCLRTLFCLSLYEGIRLIPCHGSAMISRITGFSFFSSFSNVNEPEESEDYSYGGVV